MQLPASAKVTRPLTGHILQRKKLTKLLDDSHHRQLTWIAGPGGAGKTTLTAGYIESRGLDCLWYRMDPSDNDPVSFFQCLMQAAENLFPDNHPDLPPLDASVLFSMEWFSRNFFSALAASFQPPAIWVFDNFQELSEPAAITAAIAGSLNRLPVGLRIVIISRSEPPAVFARLRTNGAMALISWNELRLSREEFAGIIRLRGQDKAFGESLPQLYDRLDGWAGGLSLLLDAARHGSFDPAGLAPATPSACFDYFATEIFSKMSAQQRAFCLKISLLPDMTPDMAADLTGETRAREVLEALFRENHFTEKRLSSPPVFLFHPLFREFLNRQAAATFSDKELEQLQQQAAAILLGANRPDEAARLLAAAGAWAELEQMILSRAQHLFDQGKSISLLSWLRLLSEDRIRTSGWLTYWLGMGQCFFAPSESRRLLNEAYTLFKKGRNPIEQTLGWCALELIHFIDCADYAPLDALIDDIFQLLPKVEDLLPPELAAMLGFHIFSALNLRQPQHPRMAYYAEQVDRMIDVVPDIGQRLMMGARLTLHHGALGELQKANRLAHILGPLARDKTVAPFWILNWFCGEAIHAVTTADFDIGLGVVTEGEALTKETGVRTTEGTLLGMGAYIHLARKDFKKAVAYLERMDKAIIPGRFFEYALHRLQEALLLALQDEPGRALEKARAALDLIQQSGSPLIEPAIRFAIGQLHTDLGNYPEAQEELAKAATLGRALKSPLADHLSAMYGAQLQFHQGNDTAGLELLKKGMQTGREKRFFWSMWDRHDVMAELSAKALQAGIETEYALEMIRKRNLTPRKPPVTVENWPWPVRIYTFGRFELVRDGQPLPASGKSQQKPLALLKVLLALGGSNVGDERVADFLWPDADGDFQAQSLRTTLHRLRKLLGDNSAILSRDHRISLNPALCWTDIWAFERQLDASDTGKAGPEEGLPHLEKGLELYKGPFLGHNSDEAWLISPRERLRSKYLRAVGRAAALRESRGEWEAAIVWYERGLETEPLIEEFYQKIMCCYHQQNRPAEARAVYQRCYNELTNGLGMETSERTRAILNDL